MGNVRLYGATSGFTELAPPAVAPDGVLSLPSGTGTIATEVFAAGVGGLVHINTTTFSAESNVSLNNVFTSDYRNYFIMFDLVASTVANPNMRLRAAGSDNTASEYDFQGLLSSSTSVVAFTSQAQNQWGLAAVGDRLFTTGTLDILRPNLTVPTFIQSVSGQSDINGGSAGNRLSTGSHRASTAFDGFTLLFATATGSISVYGYNNG